MFYKKPNKNGIEGYLIIICLLSVAGIPPLGGFITKYILISEICNNKGGIISVIILLVNLPLIYTYMRIVFFIKKTNSNFKYIKIDSNIKLEKLNKINKLNNLKLSLLYILINISSSLLIICFIINGS